MLIRTLLAAACLAGVAAPTLAQHAPPVTLSANVGLLTDYRFRGFAQTDYRPAFQGGLDLEHRSGLYVGNWNSNVEQSLFGGASLEMDFYGGYRRSFGGLTCDVGAVYYSYPGSGGINNSELHLGMSYGPVTAKYSHAVTEFFGLGEGTGLNSRHSGYLELGVRVPLGGSWAVLTHGGLQRVRNAVALGLPGPTYMDYRVGATRELKGWVLDASLVGTSAPHYFTTGSGDEGGRARAVLSMSRTF